VIKKTACTRACDSRFGAKAPQKALRVVLVSFLALALLPASSCAQLESFISLDWLYELFFIERKVEEPPKEIEFSKAVELPADMLVRSSTGSELLGIRQDAQTLCLYNIQTKELEEIYESSSDFFIKTIVSNARWVVWVEMDAEIDNAGTLARKWQIVALDLAERTNSVIDEGEFSGDYEGYGFFPLAPVSLSISDKNTFVYCKNFANGERIGSQLVYCELKSGIKRVLQESADIREDYLSDCTIYNDTVVWSRFYQTNLDDMRIWTDFRMTTHKYSDVFVYDCISEKVEQLTRDDFFFAPEIYGNYLVMVYVPLTKPGQVTTNTEIVFVDLKDKSRSIIVDENSECYEGLESASRGLNRYDPSINASCVFWRDPVTRGQYLYDYHSKVFIELPEEAGLNLAYSSMIAELFDEAIIVYQGNENSLGNLRQYYLAFL